MLEFLSNPEVIAAIVVLVASVLPVKYQGYWKMLGPEVIKGIAKAAKSATSGGRKRRNRK